MSKSVTTALVIVLIVVFGGVLAVLTLRQEEPEPTPSPRLELVGSFDLEGTITAASTASLVSPRRGSQAVESGVTGTIDIRIDEIRGDPDECEFAAGEVTVVQIVEDTVFDPPTLISSPSFPDNLTGEDFELSGKVFQDADEECHLVADRIEDIADTTGGDDGGRTPTPRVTETVSPREAGSPLPRATTSPS